MPATYEPIATTTTSSSATSVTFSSLGSYTDIIVVVNAGATAVADLWMRFNSDTASNYSSTWVYGTGTTTGSVRQSTTYIICDWYAALPTGTNDRVTTLLNIMNYSNTTTNKTVLIRANNAASGTDAGVGMWRSTAAITSITLLTSNNAFRDGSTFTLYGITAA